MSGGVQPLQSGTNSLQGARLVDYHVLLLVLRFSYLCHLSSQGCSQTCCSCEKKQRHINMKRPHRQDLCCRCKGMRLSCDATYSFKYIVWAEQGVCSGLVSPIPHTDLMAFVFKEPCLPVYIAYGRCLQQQGCTSQKHFGFSRLILVLYWTWKVFL